MGFFFPGFRGGVSDSVGGGATVLHHEKAASADSILIGPAATSPLANLTPIADAVDYGADSNSYTLPAAVSGKSVVTFLIEWYLRRWAISRSSTQGVQVNGAITEYGDGVIGDTQAYLHAAGDNLGVYIFGDVEGQAIVEPGDPVVFWQYKRTLYDVQLQYNTTTRTLSFVIVSGNPPGFAPAVQSITVLG